ncbi:uncharacterized protein SOCEGT47_000420 [Sorangium cellulosum]|uniref:TfoX N-terminal domain-containing protein n=1 Tax=Sorangium cellulosum TaxID=56 RepID=A0A4P2PSW9_SORCE|nr:hypothetical protein [Sorangium cellulosum]AUX19590.1 uncharacterized protein SOCEGT47_000420 [Sorangium cellulosum]
MTTTDGAELFSRLTERWALEPGVARSTMMGFPCLRAKGRFFASIDRDGRHLVIKLPAARVAAAIAAGEGSVFAPNGRVFREWLAVPLEHAGRWESYLQASYAFVQGDP